MHLTDVLCVLDNYDPERFHNVIANIFDVVLVGAMMLPPHALPQLEQNMFIKFVAPNRSQIHITRCILSISFCQSLELFRGDILRFSQCPQIPRYPLLQLCASHQDLFLFLKQCYLMYVLRVFNPFINIHRVCDL